MLDLVSPPSSLEVLGLGLLFGLRHATEADHLAAVGAIVSERRGLGAALRTGALWGAGHTASILVAGACVLALNLAIPDRAARFLELVVAIMIIALGGTALARALRSRHPHSHDRGEAHGWKPLLVGAVHGLAGSAALTLLVLVQIRSLPLGLAYLLVFGAGSIGGMALTSLVIGLPFAATSRRPALNRSIRIATGACSLAFGILYAWSRMAPGPGA